MLYKIGSEPTYNDLYLVTCKACFIRITLSALRKIEFSSRTLLFQEGCCIIRIFGGSFLIITKIDEVTNNFLICI